jgi:tetratricopeptide (TPR) repeat protein
MRLSRWIAVVVLSVFAAASRAQESKQEPKRPALSAQADTNDANTYYIWAIGTLASDPAAAADALYWATRIDPTRADAFDLRWAALHVSDSRRYARYLKEDPKTLRSPEVLRIDSLRFRALSLNPLLDERPVANVLYRFPAQGAATMPPSTVRMPNHGDPKGAMGASVVQPDPIIAVANAQDRATSPASSAGFAAPPQGAAPGAIPAGGDPRQRAWRAYGLSEYPAALVLLDTVLRASTHQAIVHAERGRIFYQSGNADSTIAAFSQAAAQWRPESTDYSTVVYDSKALYEFSLGIMYERVRRSDSARAAYGRAIEADPSYAPAFVRLSELDLAQGDTAKALGELDLAAQAQPRNGALAFLYASVLVKAGHDPEAIEQLRKAVVFEPYYAAPRMLIATVFDAAGMNRQAVQWYSEFLRVASRHDPESAHARDRIAALTAAPTVPKP